MTAARPLAIFGVTGRMGQALLQAMREDGRFKLSGAGASAGSVHLGQDAGLAGGAGSGHSGIKVCADADTVVAGAAVVADFSLGDAVPGHAAACARASVPLLVGATGLSPDALEALALAAKSIPVLVAPNTSVGVAVLLKLVEMAAGSLGPDYDIEILEAHHRGKRDAPSGTARQLGEAATRARATRLADRAVWQRYGAHNAPRQPGDIGFAVLRGGDIVGEHTVVFAGDGERLELTHRATDRMTFARGALDAAEWLTTDRSPAIYSMRHVLGMDSMGQPR